MKRRVPLLCRSLEKIRLLSLRPTPPHGALVSPGAHCQSPRQCFAPDGAASIKRSALFVRVLRGGSSISFGQPSSPRKVLLYCTFPRWEPPQREERKEEGRGHVA